MLKEKIYFVTAIGTDIGKTYLVENIIKKIPNSKAIKPVISGFDFDNLESDSAKILKAQNIEVNQNNLKKISPFYFKTPVSPHFAAEKEDKKIDFDKLVEFCRREIVLAKESDSFLFIEGAGGVMSPITYEKTFLDLVKNLGIDVLLVGANYLGSISHILTSVRALEVDRVRVEKIIINEGSPNFETEENDIIKTIENFTKVDTLLLDNFIDQLN